MIKIKESEIKDTVLVCPYCMDLWSRSNEIFGCCGETHCEEAVVLDNGECLLEHEYEIIEENNETNA